MIEILQSKIHRATVTDANLEYQGSITISRNLTNTAGLVQFQKVLVADVNNGNRFETYVIITDTPNTICVNGAAAHLVNVGDKVIIMSFMNTKKIRKNYQPKIVFVDDNNIIV